MLLGADRRDPRVRALSDESVYFPVKGRYVVGLVAQERGQVALHGTLTVAFSSPWQRYAPYGVEYVVRI